MSTKAELLNLNSPHIKLLATMFLIGGAWARLEYKMDESSAAILKKIDEHIISDKFEKQIMQTEINSLKADLTKAKEYVEPHTQKEFLRPSETEIQTKRKKTF